MWWTGEAKRAGPRAGASAASRDHRGVAKRLGMSGVRRWRVSSLVEDQLGHGCWGASAVEQGHGCLVPERIGASGHIRTRGPVEMPDSGQSRELPLWVA